MIAKMVALGARDRTRSSRRYWTTWPSTSRDALRALNLNSATAIELESVAGLLRKEAAAWIAHRKKAGPCTSLDEFKKVPGVPFKKIDDRRDRLVCVAPRLPGSRNDLSVAQRPQRLDARRPECRHVERVSRLQAGHAAAVDVQFDEPRAAAHLELDRASGARRVPRIRTSVDPAR